MGLERFEGKKDGVMLVNGLHYIDMQLVSQSGEGKDHQKNFGVEKYQTIEWESIGVPVVALENPDFTMVRGKNLDGSRYTLHFTINSKQNLQSHRSAGLPGPMAINDVLMFDSEDEPLLYMPRYNLFEFWCGENNVERWHPEPNEKDRPMQEAHEVWRYKVQEVFDEVAKVRVSFQHQPAYWRKCG